MNLSSVYLIHVCLDFYLLSDFRLLDILAGRKDPQGLSGHVLVDGASQPNNFKCMAGYVIQVCLDGCMYGWLYVWLPNCDMYGR